MLENVTINTVLRDHYFSILSNELSEDNITIDEELEISNSSEKYVIGLAKFLNESFYKGYVISSSILSKLMDIIEYTGYEYQVLECYINILNKSMNNLLGYIKSKPDIDKLDLNSENCISFITEYSKVIKDIPANSTVIDNSLIPHFKDPNVEEEDFILHILNEVSGIDSIYNNINFLDCSFNKAIETLYIIYKENQAEFLKTISNMKFRSEALLFLLNEDNYDAIDICIDNIKSFDDLAKYIKSYYIYTNSMSLPDIMAKNIIRIINILTINITDEQLAMIIGTDYKFWKDVYNYSLGDNPANLNNALYLYSEDPDKYRYCNPIQLIGYYINAFHYEDAYFYIRYTLLNMDYKLFCDNFIIIFNKIYKYFSNDDCHNLFIECINGLLNIHNDNVNSKLTEVRDVLSNRLHNSDSDSESYIEREIYKLLKNSLD